MNRKEKLFELARRNAERTCTPFPYKSFDEYMADAPLREAQQEEEIVRQHCWLQYSLPKDEVTYKFQDPETDGIYCLELTFGLYSQLWDVDLTYNNGDGEWRQNLIPYLSGSYAYEDLPILKMDLIQMMKKRFPNAEGWNDDFHFDPYMSTVVAYQSQMYPRDFNQYFDYDRLKGDSPFKLYTMGNMRLLRRQPFFVSRIAIIGSRKPDKRGLDVAYRLGQYHSSEIVVSGLARGIDTAAHKGCLDAGGKTIAVVGSGLDIVHPKENADLQQKIIEYNGLIISEQPDGTKANPRTLIARTRLQMALADKVVVVECEKESGTMHAVNFARKFNKPIFALDCDWSGNRYLIGNGMATPFKP